LLGIKDVEYNIQLKPNARPTRPRQFRYPPHMRTIIDKELEDWEKAGIVQEGTATWYHPVVLVRKKAIGDKNAPPRYRICLDLRQINKQVVVEPYPIPTLRNIIESLGDPPPTIYSSFDMLCGYLQLNCFEESSKLLGIQTDSKIYTLKRLPFGLVTSPFVFQQLMNKLLTGYQYIFAVAYLDDTLLYSCDFLTHLRHLTIVLDRFQDAGIRLRADRCQIAVPEIKYLGIVTVDLLRQ